MQEGVIKLILAITKNNEKLIREICAKYDFDEIEVYTGIKNLQEFSIRELQNLKSFKYLILDITDLKEKEDAIIKSVVAIKSMQKIRIIIMATGYKEGDNLLSRLFKEGIYNFVIGDSYKKQEEEFEKCLSKDGNDYKLCNIDTDDEEIINYNSINDDVSREYFAELYLRGMAIENNWITTPGLLGALKCKVEFVKDIGASETNYTGGLNQFYYGDRYWEVVPDADLAYYSEFEKEHGLDSNEQLKDKVNFNYPTHLLISTLVNPGYLMQDLNFDQHLCARQIAICTSPKMTNAENKPIEGPTYYRANEHVFNFGQYVAVKSGSDDSIYYRIPDNTVSVYNTDAFNINDNENLIGSNDVPGNQFDMGGDEVLDFTLPYKFNDQGTILYPTEADLSTCGARKFNFILHDYILGNRRDAHSADRIGYVIGF